MTLQIDSNDNKSIQQLLDIVRNKLHLNIFVLEGSPVTPAKVQAKTKWGEFAKKMDGLFTPEIIEHISSSRKEARDNFIASI